MKILMLLSRCDQTGMTTHSLDLAEALVRKGVDLTILIGYRKSESEIADRLYRRFLNTGAKIVAVKPPERNSRSKLYSAASFVANTLIRGGLIHVQSPYLSWIPWLIRRKFVSTFHVNELHPCFYYKNATHLIAISNETRDYAKRQFGYGDEEITIVNHGVSGRFVQTLSATDRISRRKELGLPAGKLLLLLVGSIEPRKGHDILLQAVSLLPDSLREKVHIVFLGSDKNEDRSNQRWLDYEIEKSGLHDSVTHFEYQSSGLFYKLCDIFVLPSWLEGFPVVTIEAMLSGNLCIRSDAEGAREQITDGATGFIFPKGDSRSLSRILQKVICDDHLRIDISAAGQKYAMKHFTADVMAENTIAVYRKTIQS